MWNKVSILCCFIGIGFYSSCDLTPCQDYACVNGTRLEDYQDCYCNCDFGWKGDDCSILDPCAGVECFANSKCVNGNCVCNDNYDDTDSCKSLLRDRFLELKDSDYDTSYWEATDTCGITTYQYEIKIRGASLQTDLEIFGLRGTNPTIPLPVRVRKNNNGDLRFNQTTNLTVINTIEMSALEGELSSDRQTIRVSYRANPTDCRGVWHRKQ